MLSKLPYDELLLNSWKNIPRGLRPESRRRAFRAGRYCAEYALCEKGGEDILYQIDEDDLLRLFFEVLIEPLCENATKPSARMADYQLEYWDRISDEYSVAADPRLKPFCDGWLKFVAEERARRGWSNIVFKGRQRPH